MLNLRILFLLSTLLSMSLLGCSSNETKAIETPMLLLIGDGGVRVEQPHPHLDPKARSLATFKNEHEKFSESRTQLSGNSWAEESSEFELLENININCRIEISRKERARQPSSEAKNFVYKISVKVTDGLKDSPFESLINGENEGQILFGEYPLNNWQSTANLVLNDTVIASWLYETKRNHYEIVKKMGENRYLKKILNFDPYLKKVTKVQYIILTDLGEQVDQQMTPLARITCS